jgi:thiosulfate dehydrogenase [quinone] large subunit
MELKPRSTERCIPVSTTLDAPSAADSSLSATPSAVFGRRWLRGAAVVRILFGVLWACDASFKWQPGFIHGQTLPDELGKAAQVNTPVIHQWLALTHMIGMANPPVTALVIAIIETLAALALIFGVLSNAAFIGSAILSFGIWSGAEAFHLPFHSGMTDLGPSVGYIFASLALFFAAAGSTWSVDSWLRPRLGAFAWLAAPAVDARSA